MTITRRDFLKASATGILVAGVPLQSCYEMSSNESQAKLFINAKFYLDANTTAENLIVQHGTVVATDVNPANWPSAKVEDLQGGFVYPGFIDSHMHLLETGTFYSVGGEIAAPVKNGKDVARGLLQIQRKFPGAKALLGFGVNPDDYDAWSLADLEAIDAVSPDKLVIIFDRLGHNCVVNSFTMRKFEIDKKEVPFGGKIVRQDGKPTGMFRESAMNLVATEVFKAFDDADITNGVTLLANDWVKRGYTGIVDLMGATGLQLMRPHIFRALEREGKLPLRIHYCYTLLGLKDVDIASTYLGQDTELVRFVGGKLFVDGAFAGGQAWTSWPHKLPPDSYGLPQITTDEGRDPELNINRIVARAEEYGMNMHYHVQGDMAIKAVLDALNLVLDSKGKLRGVHTLIHLAYPTDDLIKSMIAINARAGGERLVATTQPGFWEVESDTTQYYGERALDAYPLKKLIDSGVSVGLSTDFAVSPPEYANPTRIMNIAATGGSFAKHHPPVSVKDLIQGFTVGSAKTTGKSDVGMLRAGYKADMVVYENDLHLVDPKDMTADNPAVLSTWVGGVKMYERFRIR